MSSHPGLRVMEPLRSGDTIEYVGLNVRGVVQEAVKDIFTGKWVYVCEFPSELPKHHGGRLAISLGPLEGKVVRLKRRRDEDGAE